RWARAISLDRELRSGAHRGDPECGADDPGRWSGSLLRGDGLAAARALRSRQSRRRELVREVAPHHGAAPTPDDALPARYLHGPRVPALRARLHHDEWRRAE